MATQLFLRNTASDLGGAGQKALATTRGAASTTKVTSTVASGNDLQVTDGAGGQALEWYSGPLNPVTITGNITVNIRGLESATAANAAAGIKVERCDSVGAVLSTIVPVTSVPAASNEYTTSDTAKNASIIPTSTALAGGDRVKVTLYVRAAAGGTMGGGRTVTNSIDGPTAGAAGDTYLTLAENVSAFSGAVVTPAAVTTAATVGGPVIHAGVLLSPSLLATAVAIPTPARPVAARVKSLGTQLKPASSTATVLTLAAGISVPTGRRIIVAWAGSLANANDALVCDDSKGNTYSLYRKVTDINGTAVCALFTGPVTTALAPGDTITVTQSQSSTQGWVAAEEWSDLTIPAQTNGATGTGTSASSGTAALETAGAWFGVLATSDAGGPITGSIGAPWNARASQATATGTPRWFGLWDQTTATVATVAFNPTLSASAAAWSAAVMGLTAGTEPPTAVLIYSWVGGITSTSVTVTAHTDLADPIRLVVSADPALGSPIYGTNQSPDSSGYTRHTVTGLSAATQYYYGVELNGVVTGQKGQFRTAPSGAASFSFAIGSCAQTQTIDSFTRALARNPDLAIIHGDFPYADISSNSPGPIRDAREALLTTASVAAFIRKIPTMYTWSDHDFGANNSNTTAASKPAAQSVYRQQVPHHPLVVGDAIYHTFTYGRVRFILTDNRSFKSVQADVDNSSKTVLGATQKTWFKNLITSATEPLIIWINEQPWIGTAGTGDDEWSNYSTERTELANHISASGKRVIIMSGDMHAVAYDNGANSVGAIPVFHAAPWWNNPSSKGGPYTQGPYPSGVDPVQQYGMVDVTDSGTAITIRMRGFDGTDTVQVDATIALLTPATIATSVAFGAAGVPVSATAAPAVLATAVAFPLADASGDDPQTSPDTIATRVYMGADTEPPTVPTGLHVVGVGPTFADLGWNPSTDNVGVAFYEVVVAGPV